MADREAKLRLIFELVKAGQTQEALAAINAEMNAGAAAAEKTAGALVSTAAAADDVAESEAKAAGETGKLAGALSTVGDTATDAGQKTASASAQGAQAVQGVTASTEELASSTREAGRTAVESGQKIEDAADKAARSVEEIGQEWKDSIAAAKEAGIELDFSAAVAGAEELADAYRKSGDTLEQQKAGLSGIADQLEEDFRKIQAASEGAGTETTDQGKLIEAALANVRGKIAEVDAGLRAVGTAGAEGGEVARSSFLSVADALELANASAGRAQTKLDETGRLPVRSITELAAVIETVSIAMEKTATTSDAATAEQLQNFEALKLKLGELTEITNRQTNAAGDNAGALKESGDQVNSLTGALSGLINVTGSGSTVFGTVVQKIGAGASAYERAKDAIKVLDLNTISATKSMAAAGVQATAVAAAFTAGAVAGTKFSQTSAANRQEIERLTTALKKFKDDVLNGAIDRAGAMQDALQKMAVSTATAVQEFQRFEFAKALAALDDMKEDSIGLGIAMERGGEAARVYYALLNAGVDDVSAMKAITQDATNITKLYAQAHEQGGRSMDLFSDAVRNSGGTAAGLARELKLLQIDLAEEQRILAAGEELKKRDAEATKDQADAAKEHADALRDLQIAQRASQTAAVEAATGALLVEQAVNGSSEAVNILVRGIREHVAASAENAVALKDEADALQERLDSLDGLGASQRARIQELIDMAQRGEELTKADQLYVAQLATVIENGNRAAVSTRERATATGELTEAVRELTGSEQLEDAARQARAAGLQTEIDLLREAIDEEERRLGIRKLDAQANQYAGASLDFLRMKEKQLQEEQTQGIYVVRAATEAKAADEDARTKLTAIIEREKAASEGVAAATQKIITTWENGKATISNVTEEMRKHAEKTIEVSTAHETLGVKAGTSLGAMESLRSTVPALAGDLDALIEKAAAVEAAFDRMTTSINNANAAAAK